MNSNTATGICTYLYICSSISLTWPILNKEAMLQHMSRITFPETNSCRWSLYKLSTVASTLSGSLKLRSNLPELLTFLSAVRCSKRQPDSAVNQSFKTKMLLSRYQNLFVTRVKATAKERQKFRILFKDVICSRRSIYNLTLTRAKRRTHFNCCCHP